MFKCFARWLFSSSPTANKPPARRPCWTIRHGGYLVTPLRKAAGFPNVDTSKCRRTRMGDRRPTQPSTTTTGPSRYDTDEIHITYSNGDSLYVFRDDETAEERIELYGKRPKP